MRVLHIINSLSGGGRERRMVQLVIELSHNPSIIQAAIVYSPDIQYEEVNQVGLRLYVMSTKGHYNRFLEMRSYIKDFMPDIVHSWSDTPLELLNIAFQKYCIGYRYVAGFVADGNVVPIFTHRGLTMRFSFLCADAVVSNSQAGLKAKKAPKKKSYVIYNGFDFHRLDVKVERDVKRAELGIASKYIISMMARMNKFKDWMAFFEVARMAQNNHVDATFLAVGDGDLLEQYEQFVEHNNIGNVCFLGRRSDVEELLQITDVAMLFSGEIHAEGVSNSIMEAMASGVPVIATMSGGTPEIISNGRNSYIVPMHDSAKAYTILCNLLDDENVRREIGENAKEHIQKCFLISDMGNNYISLYNKLLQK